MRNLFILITLFIFLGNKIPTPPESFTLKEAVDQKLIRLDIRGNASSPHYCQPLKLTIKNLNDSPFIIKIPTGQRFLTVDKGVQDMLVVKSEQLAIAPGYQKSIVLNAMCTQKQNRGPAENEAYYLGPIAESHLFQVSEKIEELEAFSTVGQYAVWSISNDLGLENIAGFDEIEAEKLQQFVSKITGKKIPKKDTTDYLTNYNRPSLAKRTVGGKFEYGVVKTTSVTIGLFSEQNIIVRELLNQPETIPGDHILKFEFDMEAYTDPIYFVRLIINGEIKLSYKIES